MNVLIIDAQGGGAGRQLIAALKEALPGAHITAVGTNSAATANMLKAGAHEAATGENPVVVCSRKADVIAGPAGIIMADSMLGEITPAMALAVARSSAKKVLLPFSQCGTVIVGVSEKGIGALVQAAVREIKEMLEKNC
ncbi:MAG: DUF3842 family protein [Abditibacteriota bacterium]|nr:DUF3842 family protein [Abditibacteriota bacterium]